MKFRNLSNLVIISLSLLLSSNIYSVVAADLITTPRRVSDFFSSVRNQVQNASLYTSSIDASKASLSLDKLTVSNGIYLATSSIDKITLIPSIQTTPVILGNAWQGTPISSQFGGTGMSTYNKGDIIYADSNGSLTKLGSSNTFQGSTTDIPAGYVLTMSGDGGVPVWGPPGVGPMGPTGPTGSGGGGAPGYSYASGNTNIYPAGQNGTSGGTLTVNGEFIVNNSSNATFSAGLQATTLNVTSTSATTTFSTGGLTIGTSQFVVQQNSGNIGIGTTSPWAQFSINPNGISGPIIAIGSSTATYLVMTNGGSVGIGSTSPFAKFGIVAGTDALAGRLVSMSNSSGVEKITIRNNGWIGVGTSTPSAKLSVVGDGFTTGRLFAVSDSLGNEKLSVLDSGVISATGAVTFSGGMRNSLATDGSIFFAATPGLGQTGTFSQDNANLFWDDTNNRLGIGTTSPYARVSISANASDTYNPTLFAIASSTEGTATTTIFSILASGNVGIGVTPSYALHVKAGTSTTDVAKFEGSSGNTACTLSATTGILTCTSDARLKHDITPFTSVGVLDQVLALKPSTFLWNEAPSLGTQYGFIAQEVEEIFPTLVKTDKDNGYKSISQIGLTPFIVAAIQEQQAQIDALNKMISANGTWNLDGDGVLTVTEIKTNKLCIGVTCIDEATLQAILKSSGIDSTASHSSVPVIESTPDAETPVVGDLPRAESSDVESPVITLVGSDSINLKINDSYVDPGATVADNVNNNLGVQTVGAEIDTSVAGIHTVTYNATDEAGNKALEVTRTVTVTTHDVLEVGENITEE